MMVLHITTGLRNEGAQAVLYRLVTNDRQHTHQVISLMDSGSYGEKLSCAGIPVHALDMPSGSLTLYGLVKLFRLIRKINPDVIQTWMYHANLVGGVIARIARKHVVIWGIHHSDLESGKLSPKTRLVAHMCAWLSWFVPKKIVCCSEAAAAVHVSLDYSSRKIAVVHNGISTFEFKPNEKYRIELRNKLGVQDNEVLIGMVARWDSHKDHATLIAALGHLKSVSPRSWRCILIGSGMNEANHELICLLNESGVRDRFILAGLCDDVAILMNALDLHVLSSSGESFGNVTVEAMASGVPAIVTDVGVGLIIVGKTGWVVPPSNPEAMSDAILMAINDMEDEATWTARKSACRKRVIENFSVDEMVRAYRAVWENALKRITTV